MLRRQRRDRGTALLLVPAAVFAMLVLGAVMIDAGLAAVRARELRVVAASAANDSLAALDLDELYATGAFVVDQDRATQIVATAVAAGPLPDAEIDAVTVGTGPAGEIEITVQLGLDVDLVVAPAIPGAVSSVHLTATESVLIVTGPT